MIPASGLLKFLLCTFLLLKCIALAEDTNHFIDHGFNETSQQLNGSAKIIPDSGLLQLTNLSYEQIGHAFFPTPFKFNKPFSFSTTFAFAIVPERPAAGGQGFMFVISPSVKFEQAQAEEFGIFNKDNDGNNSNHIFGVEFDTIKSLGLKERDNNHVAIDVNSVLSNVSEPAGYYSGNEKIILQLISGNLIRAWIDYDDEGKIINVTIAPSTIEKPKRPLISTSIDLSSILLDSMYVGFSSCTGTVSSSCHYILGWSFSTSGPAENLDISKLPPIPPPAREPEISQIPPPEREAEIPPIPPFLTSPKWLMS